jgi:hypothetical protein
MVSRPSGVAKRASLQPAYFADRAHPAQIEMAGWRQHFLISKLRRMRSQQNLICILLCVYPGAHIKTRLFSIPPRPR